jgi:hypothetical protein
VNQDETLKVKIPIIGKGPFTLNVRKDGEDVPATSYRISELDGTVTFTIPSMHSNLKSLFNNYIFISIITTIITKRRSTRAFGQIHDWCYK